MTYQQDPNALLDYTLDWTAWLDTGETIDTSEWFVDAGLTVGATSSADGLNTVWLSGGTDGVTYRVTNRISSSDNRVDERSFYVRIGQR